MPGKGTQISNTVVSIQLLKAGTSKDPGARQANGLPGPYINEKSMTHARRGCMPPKTPT